jgi:hypothetical protein
MPKRTNPPALNHLKPAGVAAVVALLCACTTLKPLPPRNSPAELRSQLRSGDKVRVTTKDGQRLSFSLTEVGEANVAGTHNGKDVQLPYEQVALIEVSRVDTGKTVTRVLLGTVAVACAAFLIVIASC